MKTFYSAADIEQLASQGVRELAVDDDTVLTAVAREAAAQLGVRLVAPGPHGSVAAAAVATPAASPLKPRGCQHGPAGSGHSQAGAPHHTSGGGSSQVVDDLIGAVKQLAKRG
ncbi:MAG TPA: hypothetical protein PLJ35_03935 [Anaerolineae bacterium]|nr:hypothetical protein [Anaerolineae bacterium]HOQ97952.1 hypothetical protein [Anaerolineae bacterium]HPL28941.1 hypothetical protein [Anaerolineae bacterium]